MSVSDEKLTLEQRALEIARFEVFKRISDIAVQLDTMFDGKPLDDVCAALALTLIGQLKLHEYPGTRLLEELETFIRLTVLANPDKKERVH
jgi:hypothetical protein